jgi:hypothetical protein
MTETPSANTEQCFGHEVPAFPEVFPRLYQTVQDQLTPDQVSAVAEALGEEIPDEPPSLEDPAQARKLPDLLLAVNRQLSLAQLQELLGALSAEELASQSLFLGDEGRRRLLSGLDPERTALLLDRTPDWVLLETGKRALARFATYTATLHKNERIDGKLQGEEVIELKYRSDPRAFYLRWVDGPFKGRQVLYNERLLGTGKIRVREKGLLGLAAATIPVDSKVARRGTKHLATELGLSELVALMERDYVKAEPRGHVQRVNHGLVEVDGRPAYRLETRLPRDPSHGYYCHRVVHTIDHLAGYAFQTEVYDFDDQLDEWYHYRQVNPQAALTDADFDPKNRAYKL